MVDEKEGYMTSVLCQQHGPHKRPVAYFYAKLDAVAQGLPACHRAVAAAEKAVLASRDIVAYSPLTLLVPHVVHRILQDQKVSHLSAQRWLRYHTTLLDMPNITVKRCTSLNPATLLPTAEDGEPHDCVAVLTETCTPRLDLKDEPLTNPDLVLFVDGSASRDRHGVNKVGCAVVTASEVLVAKPLPSTYSAQAAELVALIEACKLAEGKSATVFTDSRYAWGVASDFAAIWKHRKFLTSNGTHIKHHQLVAELLESILLPKELAIVKCAAHQKGTGYITKGNAKADLAAKAAALKPHIQASAIPVTNLTVSLADIQSSATAAEIRRWKQDKCSLTPQGWMHAPTNKPCLPKAYARGLIKIVHGRSHMSKGGIVDTLRKQWWGLPTRISSDNGTPFVQRGLIDLTKYLDIDMRKHCSYHPASAGAVERMNGTLKNGLAKMHQDTGLSWVKCLPLVLWQIRTRPQPKTGLSAFEIVFGRPPNIGVGPPLQDQVLLSDTLVAYCSKLYTILSDIYPQVKAVLPSPADQFLHDFKPGDWVLIKDLRRQHWKDTRWRGPYQMLP
ncbi:uncharacterized protein [Hoplias malabaricus]|uniref:uncharacterized protein n=1 Tax=Hoplias malabaricus TaxID=27720 RepID=UPI0034628D43